MAALTVDEIQLLITASTSDVRRQLAGVQSDLQGMQKNAQKVSTGIRTSMGKIGKIAGFAILTAGTALFATNIGSAIKRVDTLKNSAKVFKNMGFTVGDTQKAMKDLDESLQGLPTPIDEAVRGVQALAATSGDVKLAQKTFSSLNNGILAFGGTAENVQGAVLQLSQLPMDGPLDAQTWNSLRNNGLTPVFAAMAKDSGKSIAELKADFGSGKLTVEDFTKKLIELNEKGGGGMASLKKQAKDATSGIGTGFANAKTAVVRGMSGIIESIGASDISDTISSAGKTIENALTVVGNFIKEHKGLFKDLATSIAIVGTAFIAASIGVAIFNAIMAVSPITWIVVGIAALVAGLVLLEEKTGIFSKAWEWLTDKWNKFKDAMQPVVDKLSELYGWFNDNILPTLKEIGNWVKDVFIGAWNDLKDSFDSIKESLAELYENLKSLMPVLKIIGILIGIAIVLSIALAVAGIVLFVAAIVLVATIFAWVLGKLAKFFAWLVGKISEMVTAWKAVWPKIKEAWDNAINSFKEGWSKVTNFAKNAWQGIKDAFSNAGSWFKTNVVDKIVDTFKGIGDKIKGFFEGIWSGISGSLKSIINSVLRLPLNLPTIKAAGKTLVGGQTLIPALAKGGIVTAPTLAMVGEGREAEAVLPLSKLSAMIGGSGKGTTIHQTNNVYTELDMRVINRKLTWELNRA